MRNVSIATGIVLFMILIPVLLFCEPTNTMSVIPATSPTTEALSSVLPKKTPIQLTQRDRMLMRIGYLERQMEEAAKAFNALKKEHDDLVRQLEA